MRFALDGRSGSSLDPYIFELSVWLNSSMLGYYSISCYSFKREDTGKNKKMFIHYLPCTAFSLSNVSLTLQMDNKNQIML